MALMTKSFRTALPDFKVGETFGDILDALSLSLERVRVFLRGVMTESNPGTAEDTLPEWYAELGITYDSTLSLDARQKQARQKWTATGGQYLDFLNSQIQIAFPDVEIVKIVIDESDMCGTGETGDMECAGYPSWLTTIPTDGTEVTAYYYVTGDLDNDEDLTRLEGLLERIAPAEMEPVYSITVASETDTSQSGIAVCGYAECNAE